MLCYKRPDALFVVRRFAFAYWRPQRSMTFLRLKPAILSKNTCVWDAILTKSNLRNAKNKWHQFFSGWSSECLERPEPLEWRLHVANFFIRVYENPKLCDSAKYLCQPEATQNRSIENGDKFMETQLFSNRWNTSTSLYCNYISLLMVRCTSLFMRMNFQLAQGRFRAK